MAHSLGLIVVAGDIQTKEKVELLNELQRDYLHQLFFNKPVPAKQLIKFSADFSGNFSVKNAAF